MVILSMTVWASSMVGLVPFRASAPAVILGPFLVTTGAPVDGAGEGVVTLATGAGAASFLALEVSLAADAFEGGEGDFSCEEAWEPDADDEDAEDDEAEEWLLDELIF